VLSGGRGKEWLCYGHTRWGTRSGRKLRPVIQRERPSRLLRYTRPDPRIAGAHGDPPGKRLGPYEIVSAIGAGGMGEVYRARDTRLDRIVAIKVLPAHLADDPERRERFEREARTIASLNHPHICTLYDIGRQDGIDYLVLEYLEGETVAQRLIKGPLPLEQVLQFAIEIADALDKAHRKGITHRDLKPGNIMLIKSGSKLLDFGLAKTAARGGSRHTAFPASYSRRCHHRARRGCRHVAVHGARATRSERGGRPHGHFRVRRGSVRNGDRQESL